MKNNIATDHSRKKKGGAPKHPSPVKHPQPMHKHIGPHGAIAQQGPVPGTSGVGYGPSYGPDKPDTTPPLA